MVPGHPAGSPGSSRRPPRHARGDRGPAVTTVAVVVPTHHRPASLAACLGALAAQDRAPDEVLVVARAGDADSARVVADAPISCTYLELDEPGVLAAMAAGARASTSDVVCFTDDDAVAPTGWIAGLLA